MIIKKREYKPRQDYKFVQLQSNFKTTSLKFQFLPNLQLKTKQMTTACFSVLNKN